MALSLVLIFLLVAVLGRVVVQYKLTGDHGIRPAGRASSNIARLSSLLILMVFAGLILVSVLTLIYDFKPKLSFGIYGEIVGVVLSAAGILLTAFAQLQMGKDWRMGVDDREQTQLVTRGIYARIRNPVYTGVMLFGLGLLVLMPFVATFLLAALGYVSIDLHVRRVEEPYLRRLHGEAFMSYERGTGRYLPKVNRSRLI